MINALHIFSVSYFTGNIKITTKEQPADQETGANQDGSATAAAKGGDQGAPADSEAATEVITAEAPNCPPEQKQKVMNAINAYVQAAQASPGKQ